MHDSFVRARQVAPSPYETCTNRLAQVLRASQKISEKWAQACSAVGGAPPPAPPAAPPSSLGVTLPQATTTAQRTTTFATRGRPAVERRRCSRPMRVSVTPPPGGHSIFAWVDEGDGHQVDDCERDDGQNKRDP